MGTDITMLNAKNAAELYAYRVFWSDEDGAYICTAVEFPSLSNVADTQVAALRGMVELVQGVIEDLREAGERVPEPLGIREYSGKFVLRMPPAVHRRVAMEAAEAGVSINQLLLSRV